MASLKMVRCNVRRADQDVPSARFVPLEIFDLWSYLMTRRHGFDIQDRQTSIWMAIEDGPEIQVTPERLLRVDEVCLQVFAEKDRMFRRICRYFPVAERDRLTRILLRHYAPHVYENARHPQITERAGVWVIRRS